MARFALLILLVAQALDASAGPAGAARWLWGWWADSQPRPGGEVVHLVSSLTLDDDPLGATAQFACDDRCELWVNGAPAGTFESWQRPTPRDVGSLLHIGANRIAVRAINDGSGAGVIGFIDVTLRGGLRVRLVTDDSWRTSPAETIGWNGRTFEVPESWKPGRDLGPDGTAPWTQVAWTSAAGAAAARAGRFQPADGLAVAVVAEDLGSLIAVETDRLGGVFVSSETDGVLRIEDSDGDGTQDARVPWAKGVFGIQGMCWTDGRLYVVGIGPTGQGVYTTASATEAPTMVQGFVGPPGGHGAHGIIPGRDGRLLVMLGNEARIDDADPRSPYQIHYEGHLLERDLDPRGQAHDVVAPGGTLVSIARSGGAPRIIAGGFRNAYDLAMDRDGELFTFDSDMEWDLGLPWYRPVRLLHVVPGGEYGWRTGSSKWPDVYPDALPALLSIGRGSPTGMLFYRADQIEHTPGTMAATLGARLDGSMVVGDWALGDVSAYRIERSASGFEVVHERLVRGQPLNVTDLAVDRDGSILIVTGGRGTHGGLYRIVAERGPELAKSRAAATPEQRAAPSAQFGQLTSTAALVELLGSDDRETRFRAARALETRPVESWRAAVLESKLPRVRVEGLIALARLGLGGADPASCRHLVELAGQQLASAADPELQLGAARALELLLLGKGAPPRDELKATASRVAERYPTGDTAVDRELATLLVHLDPAAAVHTLMARLPVEESRVAQLHIAYVLARATDTWSTSLRVRFRQFLATAATWGGGNSYDGYIRAMMTRTEWMLDDDVRAALGQLPKPKESRPMVLSTTGMGGAWTTARVSSFVSATMSAARRSPVAGQAVFEALCARCHTFSGGAGGIGPDLTTIAGRFGVEDLARATVEPSAAIADGYRSLVVRRRGGVVEGLPTRDDDDGVKLLLVDGSEVEVAASDIEMKVASESSLMPEALLDVLTLEQVSDLFAYLLADRPVDGAVREALSVDSAPEESVAPWETLFDGRTLTGWEGEPALWSVDEGAIVGAARDRPGSSFLIRPESYGDFVLELDVKLITGNSGIQFRGQRVAPFRLAGYQADIGDRYWGALYEEGGRGMLVHTPPDVVAAAFDPGGWNHYVVEARGDRIRLELNGIVTTEVRDSRASTGLIGLQLHGAGATEVRFRNLRVRRLGGEGGDDGGR